ncbi:hypothetical protein [Hufsiella ginkgonis]|uniref:Uncharacterized protein n=1 Tax=Hufsiella ginkgonis TaxID=2695274 RepID=A0A7K1Y3W9_9SPHI|nr:hypothetical protein [Hufsiella ginkgonis]MXV17932.1 hypothetical protein [Hufsiella ginkgonis]
MKKFSDETIIAKARVNLVDVKQAGANQVDVAVDLKDEKLITHNYAVTFRRDGMGSPWVPADITEISSM